MSLKAEARLGGGEVIWKIILGTIKQLAKMTRLGGKERGGR